MSLVKAVTLGGFAVAIVLGSANIIGGSVYDFLETRKSRAKGSTKGRRQAAPLISILILAQNNEKTIEACLDSLRKSRQRKHEIIVVDNCSKDSTRELVKSYAKKYRGQHIKLVAKRRQTANWPAISEAFKRYAKGDLIVTLLPDTGIDKEAFSAAAKRFLSDDKLSTVLFSQRVQPNDTVAGLMEEFDGSVVAQWNKLLSLFGPKYQNGSSTFMYNRQFFKQMASYKLLETEIVARRLTATNLDNRAWHSLFASEAIAYRPASSSLLELIVSGGRQRALNLVYLVNHRRLFAANQQSNKFMAALGLLVIAIKQLALLAIPALVTFFIWLAASFSTAMLMVFSWAIVSLFLFVTLWGDGHYKIPAKIRLSLQLPIMYALIYIRSFSQLVVIAELVELSIKKLFAKTFGRFNWPTFRRQKIATSH